MKQKIIYFLAFYFMIGFLGLNCQSQSQKSPLPKTDIDGKTLISKLEKTIPDLMKKGYVPGLSIAVIQDGKILWAEGFGIKNTKTRETVDKDTVFEAASLTKPFFAYLAMKLVEAGDLDLDKPLFEYVPQEYLEKNYIRHAMDLEGFRSDWFKRITARMVLSHSSGLPHGEPRKPLPVLFEPGSKWKYSADGYLYLQRVIEHMKGESLQDIMQKMVIDPLDMTHSSMIWRDDYKTSSAVGHDVFGETTGRFRKRRQSHAGASLYTTAEDYAKFVAAVLNDSGLKMETVKEMLTPQIDCDKNVWWSLGFGIEQTDLGKGFWQWGDYGIFRNYIAAYKDKKVGVVYLTNSFNGLSIAQDIIDAVIGGGEDFGLASLNYPRYDSQGMAFVWALFEEGRQGFEKLFNKFRKEYPDQFNEETINSTGYTILKAGKVEEAIEIFKLNVETFPESANTYDSLSDAYIRNKDIELAIEAVKKTLEKIPQDTSRDKAFLDNLKNTAQEKLKQLEKK
ncbi:MAG: beta-lactamase family protein [Candidatus Aminicenantes bacterium]|nr:beta-lactamase family protein [Candidatus Aminicenantes bacterium]